MQPPHPPPGRPHVWSTGPGRRTQKSAGRKVAQDDFPVAPPPARETDKNPTQDLATGLSDREGAGSLARPSTALSLIILASLFGFLHLCNFLNYSSLRFFLDFPLIRAGTQVVVFVALLVSSIPHIFSFHIRHHAGIYLFCILCFVSTIYSEQPQETLKYSLWLVFAVFTAVEVARRVTTLRDLQVVLIIVIVPAFFVSFLLNLAFGPQIAGTVGVGSFGGRVMGSLGTQHIDAALAAGFALLFLAIGALGPDRLVLPRWMRISAYVMLAFATWIMIFALTRSIWLTFAAGLAMYLARKKQIALLAITAAVLGVLALAAAGLGIEQLLPQSVQNRIAITEERLASGVIDPRLRGIYYGLSLPFTNPLGFGYAGGPSTHTHNTYFNVIAMVGVPGFLVCAGIVLRSIFIVASAGSAIAWFFFIGGFTLMIHAFFENQSLPGQAHFMVLLIWYALTRSTFMLSLTDKNPSSALTETWRTVTAEHDSAGRETPKEKAAAS